MAYRRPRDGLKYGVGSTSSTIIVSGQVFKYQTGSWSLDPLAPQPAQDLVQMYGQGETKRRCCSYRWLKKKVPPTAMFRSRHGTIDATLRVVGKSAFRAVTTIRSKTGGGGKIFIDVVSLWFNFHRMLSG